MSDFAIGSWNANDPDGAKSGLTISTVLDHLGNETPLDKKTKTTSLNVFAKNRNIPRYETAWKPKNPFAKPQRKYEGETVIVTANKLARNGWQGAIEAMSTPELASNERIIIAGVGDSIRDLEPGNIVLEDSEGQHRFHFSATRIEGLQFLDAIFDSSFREGETKTIRTKFCPRVTSMFVATLYDLDFEVSWIDLLALLEMLAFYQCGNILQNYIMPAFFRFVNGNLEKWGDFFFVYRKCEQDQYFKPFFHKVTRQFCAKFVADKRLSELGHFRDSYLRGITGQKFQDDLDEAVANSSKCFYYKCSYDARLLLLREMIENRGDAADSTLKADFLDFLANVDMAQLINIYLPKKRLASLLRPGMLVVPNPEFWGVKPILRTPKRSKQTAQYESDEFSDGFITPPIVHFGLNPDRPLQENLDLRHLAEMRRQDLMAYRHVNAPRKQRAPLGPAVQQALKERAKAAAKDAAKDGPMHKMTGFEYEETVHAEQIGRVLSIGQYDESVIVEWTTCKTDFIEKVQGPGEPMKRRWKAKNAQNDQKPVFKYFMGQREVFHLKLAKDFIPSAEELAEQELKKEPKANLAAGDNLAQESIRTESKKAKKAKVQTVKSSAHSRRGRAIR